MESLKWIAFPPSYSRLTSSFLSGLHLPDHPPWHLHILRDFSRLLCPAPHIHSVAHQVTVTHDIERFRILCNQKHENSLTFYNNHHYILYKVW